MKEFFDRYKIVIFLLCALAAALTFAVLDFFSLWKLLIFIPLAAFGVVLLWKIFPRPSEEHLTIVRVTGDGSVLVTKTAIGRLVADACKAIKEVKYLGCEIENSRTGLNVVIRIKILSVKVVETGELIKEFIRSVLEDELNVKTNKIDIIVIKATYDIRVTKIDPSYPEGAILANGWDAKKNGDGAGTEEINPGHLAQVPKFNTEYAVAVGGDRKTMVVKGGGQTENQTEQQTEKSEAPAETVKKTPERVTPERRTLTQDRARAASLAPPPAAPPVHPVTPVPSAHPFVPAPAHPVAPAAPVHHFTPAPPVHSATPAQPTHSFTSAQPAPTPFASKPVAPAGASPVPKFDFAAELARRRAEREALSRETDPGNKLN